VLFLAAATGLSSCHKSKTTSAPARQVDVCSLISKEEVQAVQGSPIKEVKSSVDTNGGFRTEHCLYSGQTSEQSIDLSLIQKNADSPNARDPKEYWRISFSRYADQTSKHSAETERERSENRQEPEEAHETLMRPPIRIDGLGEAAFWSPDFTGGSLYVLKGNVFLRIRVNGPESEEIRIYKSKSLAGTALSRL
jgi:hypothetical protein